ncbi:MAG TPA: ABC transporter ATP-binding protein [Firmicutes bacterium]|nr:ABC transporter ATP-binding protein [Bacillota bacterium]
MAKQTVVELTGVHVHRVGRNVLEAIDLQVAAGEFLGIIGPNGGGKTTLLRLILGLVTPSQGRVTVLGKPPGQACRQVGYVPQCFAFDPDFPIRVWDVVAMARLGRRDDQVVAGALAAVSMLSEKERPFAQLSGGERQRVLIARALATGPRILLLDEPTTSVDRRVESEFYQLLDELRASLTIILVTHDIAAMTAVADRVACLNRRLYCCEPGGLTREILEATYQGLPFRLRSVRSVGGME